MSAQRQTRWPEQRTDVSLPAADESTLENCRTMTEQFVRDYPVAATLGIFGLGFGIGTLLGSLLADQDTFHLHRRHAEQTLGRRVLDALNDLMPEAVQRQMGR